MGRVHSRIPRGRQERAATPHVAESSSEVGGAVFYHDLRPYLGDFWNVPDLSVAVGDFTYPCAVVLGNRVYLFGQVEYDGFESGDQAGAAVLRNLPRELRPDPGTQVKLFTNTVSSDSGLWGPGYWSAAADSDSLVLGEAVNMPFEVPATENRQVVLVLEGLDWERASGSEIPDGEVLLLAPYLAPGFAANPSNPPRLTRRSSHVAMSGEIVCLSNGEVQVFQPFTIPVEWWPRSFARAFVGEQLSGSNGQTHWYGTISTSLGAFFNNSVAYEQEWHYWNEGAPFAVGEPAGQVGVDPYPGETFWVVGTPPTRSQFNTQAQNDRFSYQVTFELGPLEAAVSSGVFWNFDGGQGYALEYLDESPTKFALKLYVFRDGDKHLLSNRLHLNKPDPTAPQVINIGVTSFWSLVNEADPLGAREVFVEITNTGSLSALTFNHATDDIPPESAAIGELGFIGTIGVKPIKSNSKVVLFNTAAALGAPALGDVISLRGSWVGPGVTREPGVVLAGDQRRGVVPRSVR